MAQTASFADEQAPWLAGRLLRAVEIACLILAVGYGTVMGLGTPIMVARYQTAVPAASAIEHGQLTTDAARHLP